MPVKFLSKTVTGAVTSTILQSQSFQLVTIVTEINVVTAGFIGEDKVIGSCNCPITGVRLQPTV